MAFHSENSTVKELNINIDMTPVDSKDVDVINSILFAVCNLERPMPKLTAVANPGRGIYNVVFRGFNKNVSGKNAHEVFFGPDRHPDMDNVDDYYMNATRQTFTVRVKQRGNAPQIARTTAPSKKRTRDRRHERDNERY